MARDALVMGDRLAAAVQTSRGLPNDDTLGLHAAFTDGRMDPVHRPDQHVLLLREPTRARLDRDFVLRNNRTDEGRLCHIVRVTAPQVRPPVTTQSARCCYPAGEGAFPGRFVAGSQRTVV